MTDGQDEEPERLGSLLRPADYVTLANALLGLAAVFAAAQGQVHAAYVLVLVGVLTDGVDGAVARWQGGGGPLGAKLDTLADLIVFVVAPAVLLYVEYFDREILPALRIPAQAQPTWWTNAGVVVVSGLFLMAGLVRLARFDYWVGGGRHDLFHGLTTPGAAIVVVAVALMGRANPQADWVPAIGLGLVVASAVLMVSRRRLPKLRGPLVVPSIVVIGAAVFLGPAFGGAGPILLLAFSVAYVAFGPMYARAVAAAKPGHGM